MSSRTLKPFRTRPFLRARRRAAHAEAAIRKRGSARCAREHFTLSVKPLYGGFNGDEIIGRGLGGWCSACGESVKGVNEPQAEFDKRWREHVEYLNERADRKGKRYEG